jgi:hypothetical protein
MTNRYFATSANGGSDNNDVQRSPQDRIAPIRWIPPESFVSQPRDPDPENQGPA